MVLQNPFIGGHDLGAVDAALCTLCWPSLRERCPIYRHRQFCGLGLVCWPLGHLGTVCTSTTQVIEAGHVLAGDKHQTQTEDAHHRGSPHRNLRISIRRVKQTKCTTDPRTQNLTLTKLMYWDSAERRNYSAFWPSFDSSRSRLQLYPIFYHTGLRVV